MYKALRAALRTAAPPLLLLVALHPTQAEAQARGNRDKAPASSQVTLSVEVRAQIQDFYSSREASGAEVLPPGIRKRLERGKPLPPGIAKRTAPAELRSRVEIPEEYELVEVGVDVLLVEVATDIIHDVLMDIVR